MSAFTWHVRELVHVYTVCVIPSFLYFTICVPGSKQALCYFYIRPFSYVFLCM